MTGEPITSSVRLADGRALAYCEYGDPSGEPMVLFHGVPGSRLGGKTLDAAARRCGIRLIAPDRPGIGCSDYLDNRTIADWPADVAQLMDAIGLSQFSVLGVSGGMPYVLSCALALRHRLKAAAVLSGMGRFDLPDTLDGMDDHARRVYSFSQHSPRFASLWVQMLGRVIRAAPSMVIEVQKRGFSAPDRDTIERQDVWQARVDDLREAFRGGSAGVRTEARLHIGDWGLPLDEIAMPVLLWYGREDRSHPVAMAEHYARAIPGSRLWIEDGAGSLGYIDRMEAIFDAMLPALTAAV